MPSLIQPQPPRYVPAPPTQADLDYADLAVIDLSKAATAEGRAELAGPIRDALTTNGFFYVVNHGYEPEQTRRIFDIADIPFSHVSPEEKNTYVAKMKETGSYQGYKPRQYWHIDNGVRDQLEHYNINHDITKREHPLPLRPFLPEIEAFVRHNHEQILFPILRILALGLELPEETLVDLHGYKAVGETFLRFMKYYPRTEEDEAKTKNVWLKGHTDLNTVTILWSQPVAALQILSPDGKWRWIRHVENALVINAGDSLEFLSGGFYRPTIHRVVQPPPDQQTYNRLGVFYFGMPDDDVRLVPLSDSPVLKRVGMTRRYDDAVAPTTEAWRKGRISSYGQTQLKRSESAEGVEEEVISGVLVRHYN